MTREEIEGLPDIAGDVITYEASRDNKPWPVHSNRASEIGHPCLRYLVLNRTRWAEKPETDTTLKFIFKAGEIIEDASVRELEKAGYRVTQRDTPFMYDAQPELNITGRIDGKVCRVHDGRAWPLEIKGLADNSWSKIDALVRRYEGSREAQSRAVVEYMLSAAQPWLNKYPGQLMVYMLATGAECAYMYVKSKVTNRPTGFWMFLDYEYAESLLKKAAAINDYMARYVQAQNETGKWHSGLLPATYTDFGLCEDCDFLTLCTPDLIVEPTRFETDGAFIARVAEYMQLAASHSTVKKQYETVRKELTLRCRGAQRAVAGEYVVTCKEVHVSGDPAPEPRQPYSYWLLNVKPIGR